MNTLRPFLAACAVALAAALAPATAGAQSAPKILKKVAPDFPGDAVRKGIDKGVIKVRLTIDGAGVPTEVAVIDTQPAKAKMLGDPVAEALKAWRFEGAGKPATFELQIVMSAE
jgi:protein TonB